MRCDWLEAVSICPAQVLYTQDSTTDIDVLFLINIIILVAVICSALVLKAIVRSRRRVKPGMIADDSTPPPAVVLPRLLKIVGYGARAWAGLEALAYLGRCVYSLFAGAEFPKGYVTYFFVGSLIWLGNTCLREAKRLGTPLAEEALALDRRSPVLFLRSFASEEEFLPRTSGWYDPKSGSWLGGSAVETADLAGVF